MNIDWNKVKDGLTTMDVLKEENKELKEEIERLHSIIKEVREYIDKELDIEKICRQEKSLTICKKGLLEILDKVDKESK